MARAKITRGRGRSVLQNTSPRQTRARSARARAATVSAAATTSSAAAPSSAPATVSAAAATSAPAAVSAAASQLRQLSQWGLRHLNVRFGSISRMLLVFRRWCEMPRSQPCPGASRNATWNAAWHLPRECCSRFTPWCWVCTRRQLLVPHLLCSAAQVTVGQGPGTPEWGNAFPVQPVETNHSAPEQPLPFVYGANDNVAPWPNADFMHVPGNEVLGSLPRATQELMAVHRPVPSH